MNKTSNNINLRIFIPFIIAGVIIALTGAIIEYFIRINTSDPQDLIPLVIRSQAITFFIIISVLLFEQLLVNLFTQKTFIFLVLVRSISFTIIISVWLSIINGIWSNYNDGVSYWVGVKSYLSDNIFIVNLITIFIVLLIIIGIRQISFLFRKGELINYIIGKYHKPKEIERVFCFIDLKGSTTIGEKLGHYNFGLFLKDYYSDITSALKQTKAEIYLYVGDEIILSWTYKKALEDNNMLNCFFLMKDVIKKLEPKYLHKYGFAPEFKAGMHGGKVVVTWVGEIKKEIVYLGDVLNTTSRIQENCKRLNKEILISKILLDKIEKLNGYKASFVEEITPRGKEKTVKLYSIEKHK
jgi:adenylate cyclase